MNIKDKLTVSAAPHVHDKSTVKNVMWNVVIALVPALIFATYYWGIRALLLSLTGAVTAVVCEALIQKLRKVPITVHDGSAFLTGLLLAFNIHASQAKCGKFSVKAVRKLTHKLLGQGA